jgi:hypothetical protein
MPQPLPLQTGLGVIADGVFFFYIHGKACQKLHILPCKKGKNSFRLVRREIAAHYHNGTILLLFLYAFYNSGNSSMTRIPPVKKSWREMKAVV